MLNPNPWLAFSHEEILKSPKTRPLIEKVVKKRGPVYCIINNDNNEFLLVNFYL